MNSIIKSDGLRDLGAVRKLEEVRQAKAVSRAPADDETTGLRKHVAELEAHVQQQNKRIEQLRGDVLQARIDGETKGRAKGFADAEDRQAERLTALENGARTALVDFRGSLAAIERLAVLVARDCLDTMLGDSEQRADLLCEMIRLQVSRIEQSALLGIDVSREDFPSAGDLAALASRVDPQLMELFSVADIPPGACTMRLKLGRIHVGIDQQWRALDELLGDLALPGSGA